MTRRHRQPAWSLHTQQPTALGDARLPERFWRAVTEDAVTGCWAWNRRLTYNGYAQFSWAARYGRGYRYAHRVSYEALVGAVPAGLQIDHLCRNRACVNPTHLEPVTQAENILRGESTAARNARKTECKYRHAFDEANTMFVYPARNKGRRQRVCRTCKHLSRAGLSREAVLS